jgi:hypothetical protein
MARDAADTATGVTNAVRKQTTTQDQKSSLVLMTWNASRLLSYGRELALLHLLTSSSVDVATVTKCEMTETEKDIAVAGYTTFLPKVPKGSQRQESVF